MATNIQRIPTDVTSKLAPGIANQKLLQFLLGGGLQRPIPQRPTIGGGPGGQNTPFPSRLLPGRIGPEGAFLQQGPAIGDQASGAPSNQNLLQFLLGGGGQQRPIPQRPTIGGGSQQRPIPRQFLR